MLVVVLLRGFESLVLIGLSKLFSKKVLLSMPNNFESFPIPNHLTLIPKGGVIKMKEFARMEDRVALVAIGHTLNGIDLCDLTYAEKKIIAYLNAAGIQVRTPSSWETTGTKQGE